MLDHDMPPRELITRRNWSAPDLWDWEALLTNRENTVTTPLPIQMAPTIDDALFVANEYIEEKKPGWLVASIRRIQAAATDE